MAIDSNTLKKIEGKNWESVKSQWFEYLPIIDPPGSHPEIEISQIEELGNIYKAAKSDPNIIYKTEVTNLRQDIFREGIYLIHKANNTCCATNNQLNNGFISWPISTAYQSSFFALKGILCLLGISIPQMGMHHLIIDSFPEHEPLSKKQIKNGHIPEPTLSFLYAKGALNHKDHWQIFQRVLRVSNISVWDADAVRFLTNLDTDRFTKHRNDIHYKSNYWTWETDLYNRIYNENLGISQDYIKNMTSSISEDDTYYINYIMIKLAIDLISDISSVANNVKIELDLMKTFYFAQENLRITTALNLF